MFTLLKKILVAMVVLLVGSVAAFGQNQTTGTLRVTDSLNPTAINANAILEMKSGNKGLLLPRLALTATNAATPLSAFVAGMTVYNTATAGTAPNNVTPGYYYSDGTQWVRLPDNAWLTTGNANTIEGTNFLGTTDNKSLEFRVNNARAGYIEKEINFANGTKGMTSIGFQALMNNSTLASSTNGWTNSAFGFQALKANTDGAGNTAVGYDALLKSTTGLYNSAVGNGALSALTSGSYNTAFGNQSMQNFTSGSNNIAIGANSFTGQTSGSNNIAIGYSQALYASTGSNQLNIGGTIFGTGMTGTVTAPAGNIGINNSNPAQALDVIGNVQFSGALMANGDPGTSTYILNSNGAGTAPTWIRNQVPSATGSLSGTGNIINNTNLAFVPTSSGSTTYQSTSSYYTGSSITLPPGKWMVNVTMLLSASFDVYQASGYNAWVTGTFYDNNTGYTPSTPMADFVNSNTIVGGNMLSAIGCTLMRGFILIENSTAASKTYYFWLRGVILYSPGAAYSSFQLTNFGTNQWGEDQIVAYAIQ